MSRRRLGLQAVHEVNRFARHRHAGTVPERFGLAAEAADIDIDIREMLIGKRHGASRVVFQVQRRTVDVLRVWHSARDTATRDDV